MTLTIGLGGNTAVFGLVNALLLKPVPADRPDRLLRIQPGERTVSWTSFTAFRERTDAFSDIAAFSTEVLALGDPGATRRVIGEAVSPGYFVLMGVGAALGRPLLPTDRGLERIVLSERTWRVYFDSDPSVVGRRITLDRRRYEVVGVMPKLFRGLAPLLNNNRRYAR